MSQAVVAPGVSALIAAVAVVAPGASALIVGTLVRAATPTGEST
jgi:hypothetical protein